MKQDNFGVSLHGKLVGCIDCGEGLLRQINGNENPMKHETPPADDLGSAAVEKSAALVIPKRTGGTPGPWSRAQFGVLYSGRFICRRVQRIQCERGRQ